MKTLLTRLLRLQRKPAKPPTEPLAKPGVASLSGLLQRLGEYNPNLQGVQFYKIVDQMRNNSRILALEYLITLPIISTHWEVRPPNNASRLASEAAEQLQLQLFDIAKKSLYDLLRIGILARFYGMRLLEPVWTIADGRALINDYIDILPATLHAIEFNELGELQSITQIVRNPRTGAHDYIQIPASRLVRFTWREEGGDPLGYPDLRSLYPDWYRLEFLYSILQIAAERAGIGAWQARIPRDLWDNNAFREAINDILKKIRTQQAGALTIPEGVEITVLQAIEKQGIEGIIKMIEHYETNLAAGVLANILQVGMRDIGTQALAETLFEMFLYQLNQTARWLADNINRQICARWLLYNYPELPANQHPKLHYTDLRLLLRREAALNAIASVVSSGVLPTDANLQDYIRDLLSLPPPPTQTTHAPESAQLALSQPRNNFAKLHPTPLTLARTREDAQREESRFENAMRAYLQTIEQAIAPQLQDILNAIRNAETEPSRARALARLQAIELPGRPQYESMLYDYLRHFAIEARAALQRDYNRNIAPNRLPESLNQYLLAKAQTLARDHYEHLRSQIIYTALAEALKSTPILTAVEIVRNITSQRLNTDLATLQDEAMAILQRINDELHD